MITFSIEAENTIAIFRNEYRGRDIGEITVRTHRFCYIVAARVDGTLERLQLPQSIVALYDSFANHLLHNDFHAYIIRSEDINEDI